MEPCRNKVSACIHGDADRRASKQYGQQAKGRLSQSSPETGGQFYALLGGVKHFLPRMQSVVCVAGKHMQMKVPHILIAGWPVVLARRNALALERIAHGLRQTTRGAKNVMTQHFLHRSGR